MKRSFAPVPHKNAPSPPLVGRAWSQGVIHSSALSEIPLSETDMVKIPRVVFERFANTLAYAA